MIHTESFAVVDENMAYVEPAKALAMTVVDLMCNDAALARQVADAFTPTLTKDSYLTYLRGGGLKKEDESR